MTLIHSAAGQPQGSNPLADRLGMLEQSTDLRIGELLQAAEDRYEYWRQGVELLRGQFCEAGDLACSVTERLPNDWKCYDTSYGQWHFMGASGYGYNFGFRLEGPGQKVVEMHCGCVFEQRWGNGVGDERNMVAMELDTSSETHEIPNFKSLLKGSDVSLRLAEDLSKRSSMIVSQLDGHLVHIRAFDGATKTGLSAQVPGEFLREQSLASLFTAAFTAITETDVQTFTNLVPEQYRIA